jgi:hypothetical protein
MNLQKELRHKSEDIDDPVLLDVVKALAVGYGGSATIMISRTSPVIASMAKPFLLTGTFRELFSWLLKTVRVDRFCSRTRLLKRRCLTNCGSTTFMPIRSRCGPNATQSKQASRGGRTLHEKA